VRLKQRIAFGLKMSAVIGFFLAAVFGLVVCTMTAGSAFGTVGAVAAFCLYVCAAFGVFAAIAVE
jgi:predicted histidine transporter YuiF (NhaC family)